MDRLPDPVTARKSYEESFGLSTPPDSPTKPSHLFRLIHASSSTSLHSNFSRSSRSSAKQPRLSRRAQFLRSGKPMLDWRALENSPPYHSLPTTPYASSSPTSMRNSLILELPISPPLSAQDLFDEALSRSASDQTLAPSVSFQSERYITACSSPIRFGDDQFPTDATKNARRSPAAAEPKAMASSLENFRLSTSSTCTGTVDESMDSVDFDQFPEPPKANHNVTVASDLHEVWDQDEMPTLSGWIEDSSDEEEMEEDDITEVVDKALQRKWHVVEHDADDISFDCELIDDEFKYATMITTTKPRLITISNSSSTFSMASNVGVPLPLPVRPSTPSQQYHEISAFSPDTPTRRPESGSISAISTQEASWGPVREFWSRASSVDATNHPPLPPMFEMDAEPPIKSPRRASEHSVQSVSSKSIISSTSLAKSRQVLPPPVLSARPSEWRPSISTINQESTVADLYHAVKAFPFDSLCLSLPVITTLHSVSEASLLTPLKRIFPNASIFLLDSLAACVVAQSWVRQYCNSIELEAPKPHFHLVDATPAVTSPPTGKTSRSNSTIIPPKAISKLGLTTQIGDSVVSFSTALSSPPLTPVSPTSAQLDAAPPADINSAEEPSGSLARKLDGLVDRLLEAVTSMDSDTKGAEMVLSTLKTSVQVVVEAVLEREV